MKLVPCPACDRLLSPRAEACPNCGHPMSARPPVDHVDTCYQCNEPATQKCQRCGALSCVAHLDPVSVKRGKALLCTGCEESQQTANVIGCIIAVILVLVCIAMAMEAASR